MSSQTPINITIHNVDTLIVGPQSVPEGTAVLGPKSLLPQARIQLTLGYTSKVPVTGATHPVHPITSSALGTICVHLLHSGGSKPDEVRAMVYPATHFHEDHLPDTPPMPHAKAGQPDQLKDNWYWTTAHNNEVFGADHNDAGVNNVLVVWERVGSNWARTPLLVNFKGKTDKTGICLGSGGGSNPNFTRQGTTFPAVWMAPVQGFAGEPLGMFNGNWALRQMPEASGLVWCNGGDGKLSPRVRLHCDPKRGWKLTFAFKQIQFKYTLPWKNDSFGPLRMEGQKRELSSLGTVKLPTIVVMPM